MTKIKIIMTVLLTVCLAVSAVASPKISGQQPAQKPEQPEPDVTVLRQLKGKVFELKYRQPSIIVRAIGPLGSGYRSALINPSDEFHTITVRDFPENIASIEEAIKKLDVPESARPQINLETQVSLIAASRTAAQGTSDIPAGISTVLEELRDTLKFKSYRYVTTYVNRTSDEGNVSSSGAADSFFQSQNPSPLIKGMPNYYDYNFNQIKLVIGENGEQLINVRQFNFEVSVPIPVSQDVKATVQYRSLGVKTPLSLRDKEYVVVGTTNAGSSDEALIVVVSIRRVK